MSVKATWESSVGICKAIPIKIEVEILRWSPDEKRAEIQYRTNSGVVKRKWVDGNSLRM
jgi:hypothetical protein